MKQIFIITFYILTIYSTIAGEVTGAGGPMKDLLKKHGFSKQYLEANDLKLTLGEVTGAGRVHLDDIEAFVSTKKVLLNNQIQVVNFKADSPAKLVKDIQSINFENIVLKKKQIKAYIHKK